ncbi:MAG: hypothetical protein GC185_02675 [Alphaproteobacteria bacterium]|nr:hypothetical protein [Alphaproteobacteria bacterium]
MSKEKIRAKRNQPVRFPLDIEEGDIVCEAISRDSGLFYITRNKILCLRSPDDLDPDLEYESAPWEKSLYLPHGASDPLVARTVIQTGRLIELCYQKNSKKYKALSDISWKLMESLITLRSVKEGLGKRIDDTQKTIKIDPNPYVTGQSPKALPIIENYRIDFYSFVNEVRRTLNIISDIFLPITGKNFSNGHFQKAQQWIKKSLGENSPLTLMLEKDQTWIKTWIDTRIAIEHPQEDRYVETLNFSLEPSRDIRLPTWRLIHPDHTENRPRELLETLETAVNNLLKFYEDLQVALLHEYLAKTPRVYAEIISEEQRDKKMPMRYDFAIIL